MMNSLSRSVLTLASYDSNADDISLPNVLRHGYLFGYCSGARFAEKARKHGGANYKVVQMFEDMKKNVSDTTDEQAVADYLVKLLRREAFDQKGLIYGMGHAVYSISDPRAQVFKSFVGQLAHEKGRDADFARCTPWSRRWRPRLSHRNATSIRACLQMLIFTQVLCIPCWVCRRNCTRRCSPWHVSSAGARIAWRS